MKPPIPREHGAWGLLLQPFVAGAVLAGCGTWLLAPALGLVLFGFLLREPLTVLARHRFVWRRSGPREVQALRWAGLEVLGLVVCLGLLIPWAPLLPLLGLAAVAVALTLAALWVTLTNRQRSIPFQLVSAAGLGTTALLAAVVAVGGIPAWAWWLWMILSLHGAASIVVVHARLEGRAALRKGAGGRARTAARLVQALQLAMAVGLWMVDERLAGPLLFSSLANAAELWWMAASGSLLEPLTRVGVRTLAVSIAHALVTMACLWPLARGA